MFLEISQNSQENTCARDSFLIQLQARSATFLKKSFRDRCFPVNFSKFLRTLFYRAPPDDCFCYFYIKQPILLKTQIRHTRMQMATQSLHKDIVKSLKIDFLKTTGIAKYDIKVSVILGNKYKVKAKSFIIPISVCGN